MLVMDNTALLLVDIQGTLARTVHESNVVFDNWLRLIKACKLFNLPIIMLEQYSRGLGGTIPEVKELLPDVTPIEKITFNACLNPGFLDRLRETGRTQLLVAGIEAHVCVYQTVSGLLAERYEVHVASDAVSSRKPWNRQVALERMRDKGAVITTTEIALFEMMRISDNDLFRQFISIVK